jgi:hypothetical protein
MKKTRAIKSFEYHGERIFTPTGEKNKYHEKMREYWAWAVDSGYYKKLPDDPIEADRILWEMFSEGGVKNFVDKIIHRFTGGK